MNKSRNYGIDLLRILATFMIIQLHILGAGGIIHAIDATSPVYVISWLMEFAAYCAVNCYALISGYVGVNAKFRLSNLFVLWIQVVFINLAITIGSCFFGANVTIQDIKIACMPVTTKTYWYFTAYVCLYFVTPFLNQFLQNCSKKMANYLLLVLLLLFSVVPTIWESDLFFINQGYSAWWLIILYLAGGVIKKYYFKIHIKKRVLLGGYAFAVILTLLSKLGIEYLTERTSFAVFGNHFLMNYNSPTIVLAGVCLFLLFMNLKVEKIVKPIAFFAPFTFGIYIIHSHSFMWEKFIVNRYHSWTELHPIVFVGAVVLATIAIFGICSFMEFLRTRLFRVLRIAEFSKFIEEKLKTIFKNV